MRRMLGSRTDSGGEWDAEPDELDVIRYFHVPISRCIDGESRFCDHHGLRGLESEYNVDYDFASQRIIGKCYCV